MITGLGIRNFKCFASIDLPMRELTVLTGINGAGKSTVLQALLLARQAAESSLGQVVKLNGPYGLELGEAGDVIHPNADPAVIEVIVKTASRSSKYAFAVPDERTLNLPVIARDETAPASLSAGGTAFTYLNAERLGPRDQLDVTADEAGLVGVGVRGEYTAQTLAMRETDEVRPLLRHPQTPHHGVTTLRTQVENWASTIIRPIRIIAQWPPGITASMIRFQEPELIRNQLLASEQIRPANMGFGFSYALPIIVAGLLMPAEGILIVENPEAHLHPAGQSRLGRFLARVAGSGAQVIVETHSDHIINGIRLAVAEDSVIPTDKVLVHFFGNEAGQAPEEIEVTSRGALTSWPQGFFDQIEEDLGGIARAKRQAR